MLPSARSGARPVTRRAFLGAPEASTTRVETHRREKLPPLTKVAAQQRKGVCPTPLLPQDKTGGKRNKPDRAGKCLNPHGTNFFLNCHPCWLVALAVTRSIGLRASIPSAGAVSRTPARFLPEPAKALERAGLREGAAEESAGHWKSAPHRGRYAVKARSA